MPHRPNRFLAAAALLAAASVLTAQEDKKQNLTGSWKFSMHGDHVIPGGLTLEQEGTKVKGIFMFMNNDIPVQGEFAGGVVSLSANARMQFRGPGGEDHGGGGEDKKMKIEGKMIEDGTLSGEMEGPRGPIHWTAERFKERKVPGPKTTAAAAVNVSGAWTASAGGGQGTMKIDLNLKQDGAKLSGTLKSDHSGELAVEGMIVDRTLVFVSIANVGGPGAIRIEYTAKLKDDGTLTGELVSPMGRMAWTAARAK